jgi:hypothetical protein
MPGKNDVVTVRTKEGKEKRQKKLLVMTIEEMYQTFKNEFPGTTIGKSKFAELRPSEVLLSSNTPRNVCGCIYHTNVILMLEALHEHSDVPLYNREKFTDLAICEGKNRECFWNDCEACSGGKKLKSSLNDIVGNELLEKDITWYRWGKGNEGFLTKEVQRTTVKRVIDDLVAKSSQFLWHIYVKEAQSMAYNSTKAEAQQADSKTVLLQMDFAENFGIHYQVRFVIHIGISVSLESNAFVCH